MKLTELAGIRTTVFLMQGGRILRMEDPLLGVNWYVQSGQNWKEADEDLWYDLEKILLYSKVTK